jgi:nucleoside-diphosphate-sugar epimerase
MKVCVAGGSGAIGRQLVPQLVAAGHEVVVMTRTEDKSSAIRALGASAVVADALNPAQVAVALSRTRPEVVVHQLTSIAAVNTRRFDRDLAATNRLRREGTDHLLSAAHAVGVGRFVAQSYCVWLYARTGSGLKVEKDGLDGSPVPAMRESLAALRHLEDVVLGAGWTTGIVLRYGALYGPGTSLCSGGEQFEMVRGRRFPVIGAGTGVWSFVHVTDAASATVAAIERGEQGAYNIVDDEPAPVDDWLPALAGTLGARPPRRVPRLVGRMFAGEAGTVLMTEIRGASNQKAKSDLNWKLRYPSWREGFAQEAGAASVSRGRTRDQQESAI